MELTSNGALILDILKDLSKENFIEKKYLQNGAIYFWGARQLVQQAIIKKHNIQLQLDTIYRHFRNLDSLKKIEYIKSGYKDCFILYDQIKNSMYYDRTKVDTSFNTQLKDIFVIKSKNKITKNAQGEYQNFIEYYKNKQVIFRSKKFLYKKWEEWCININEYIIPFESYFYNDKFKKIGSKKEFEYFKNYYEGLGIVVKNPFKLFKSWIKKGEKLKSFTRPKTIPQNKEKQEYKWSFRQAKEISDKIKDFLDFEKKINWLDDYYWQGKSIPGIGWQKVMHPDFYKEEILLFRLEDKILIDNIEDIEIVL